MTSSSKSRLYTERERVYSGPFCDIYRSRAPSGDAVALKVVDLDFLYKPHNFLCEIRLLLRLSHPHIVSFIESFSQGDDHCMVMAYYEVDLKTVLDHYSEKRLRFNLQDPAKHSVVAFNTLPVDCINPMVWALVLALKHIHASGIIHRDIKPANIMFPSLHRLDCPVIGDFGISYDVASPPPDEPLDKKYTDVSTGYFKAPELCFGVTDYGTEIDLWSLGIVISTLFSKDGNPANYVPPAEDEFDAGRELYDFVLILGIFSAFGTPDVSDKNSDLYWEKLGDSKYHFVNFQYTSLPRKRTDLLLPRCTDDAMRALFELLTRYDNRRLLEPPAGLASCADK
ncbi:kinase-like protein [Metschnikowia bicuspidata]|uniref:Kinase-like protein n=1 Tax=Metschnikowia bicuspidata TaxID=27322 RepID=A0A4P9ZD49_9ASCO|nr:kinase-like protein [Metschnikowia bicuspidata]